MTTEKATRTYRMRRRAEAQEQTRLRITEAAVELHGTLGPARTSVKAVAERAGVERATVYRHFPNERALFLACSNHWRAANPSPDPATWAAVADPDERLRVALTELYAYYAGTEEMLGNLLRDAATVPIVAELMEGLGARLDAMRTALLRGRLERGRARRDVRAALGHALAFATWSSLVREEGLPQSQAVRLMCGLVAAAGAPLRGRTELAGRRSTTM
jgi:AcrR family transcriptional regulator